MIAVIMAGGKGTRIASVNSEVPKPMIPIMGKPILEYEIENLRQQGIKEFILTVGYLKDVIREYFGDGSRFGVSIDYITENEPLGTAGALYFLKGQVTEDFLLLNGDMIFDVDAERFAAHHRKKGRLVTILTHPNSHPYDSGVIVADEEDVVTKWMTKEDERLWYRNRINAGLHMISPALLDRFENCEKKDLDRDILKPLIAEGQLCVYDSPEYIKDMGTPDRFYSVTEDIKSEKVHAKNLKNKQKAVFLDRDGVINEYVGFLRNIDDFRLIEGVAEAIRTINEKGYLAIVITNQPVIARGEVTRDELREIHNKMETLLGKEGAYLDDIYICPHHPDKGFEGEISELKIECDCRKPKPGLILQAAKDYNINLTESYMVGDSLIDMEAGQRSGCHPIYLGADDVPYDKYDSLNSFVRNKLQ